MSGAVRSVAALVVGALLSAGAAVYAQVQAGGTVRSEGRRLADALADLQRRGLKIIYSSQLVAPDMRVLAEPRVTSLRRILDELLSPHGLIAQDGPGGTVLIVKNPRARPQKRVLPQAPQVVPPAAGEGSPRFEEAIQVTDTEPRGATTSPSSLTLVPLEVRAFPGGFENIFRTLQALPGVSATEELGSRITVRGGSPDQNLTVMDGIEIPNPYRLIVPSEDLAMVGLAGTFNPEIIKRFEFVPGAFDVRHGDRLSSLLVVTHREGSESEVLQGSSFLSLAEANVILEGKLPRAVTGSWLVSARRSHLDLVAERAVGTTLPSFQDVHARVSWRPRPRQRVLLVGLAGKERTRPGDSPTLDAGQTTRTQNTLAALTFESSAGSRGSSRTIASFSRFAETLNAYERSFDNSRGANTEDSIATGGLLEFQLSRDIAVRDLAVRQEFVFKPSDRHWLDLGLEIHRLDTRWAWGISGDRSQHQANGSSIRLGTGLPDVLDSSRDTHRFGAWAQDLWELSPRLALQPGIRLDRSSLTGQTTISPRLSSTLSLGGGVRLETAVSVHAQSPGYEKVLQSDYFIDLSQTTGTILKAERAVHAVAGLQRHFSRGLSARVDTYYKRFRDLLVGRLETDDERVVRLAGYDVPPTLWTSVPSFAQITTVPVNAATGQAYGVEASVAYAGVGATAPVTGWVAYSLGRADRTAYGVTYPFDYDRRHAGSIAANLKLGSRVDLSTTGRWATGLPRTPVSGVRLALIPDASDLDGDGNRDERVPQRDGLGNPVFQPDLGTVSSINSARLPAFGRLDARVTYRPSWSGERWAFYLDLLNILNRRNVTQVDSTLVFDPASDRPGIVERAQDRGIPFFPSFGIRFWF